MTQLELCNQALLYLAVMLDASSPIHHPSYPPAFPSLFCPSCSGRNKGGIAMFFYHLEKPSGKQEYLWVSHRCCLWHLLPGGLEKSHELPSIKLSRAFVQERRLIANKLFLSRPPDLVFIPDSCAKPSESSASFRDMRSRHGDSRSGSGRYLHPLPSEPL